MNCWDILGIEPTRNRAEIEAAFERQRKFAEGEELRRLEQAFLEATGETPVTRAQAAPRATMHVSPQPEAAGREAPERHEQARESQPLSASEQQIVREVIIQVRAMLNDPVRVGDVAVWRAIVTEPPADQRPLRQAIADGLEADLRPMAENGALAAPVARFLADWFEWYGVVPEPQSAESGYGPLGQAGGQNGAPGQSGDNAADDPQTPEQPPMTNFVPLAIGWVVGLVVLYSLFSALLGGG